MSLHTKVAISVSLILTAVGFLLFLILEYNNPRTLGAENAPAPQKAMQALFQSISARTAGFAAIPQDGLMPASKIVTAVWMFIGGSPSSMAGGIKTTTIALLFLFIIAIIRGKEDVVVFKRTVRKTIVLRSVVTTALGVVFVWMMVRVYNTIDTVPTWYSVWTPLGFFLMMFMGGPLLGYLLLRIAGVDGWAMRLLPAISVLALVVSAIMSVMQGAELATIHSSIQQASALVPDYGSLMAWRIVALALALCCWIVPQVKGYQPAVPLLSVAFILLLVGELIGRGVFYGLHMTVGMAVAS
ncbi:hypothetical protein SDC9_138432 [bioreactor metagenome]|uniref:Anaerobic dimethyl sulfoxide reductase chain C n=1 Tax=bioreactor metagenome TaxID=1076179 RepID=A0A645DPA3_9ZZZZ